MPSGAECSSSRSRRPRRPPACPCGWTHARSDAASFAADAGRRLGTELERSGIEFGRSDLGVNGFRRAVRDE